MKRTELSNTCRKGHDLDLPNAFTMRRVVNRKTGKVRYVRACSQCRRAAYERRRDSGRLMQSRQRSLDKWKREGRCLYCGGTRFQDRTLCWKCLKYDADRQARKRAA